VSLTPIKTWLKGRHHGRAGKVGEGRWSDVLVRADQQIDAVAFLLTA